MTTRDFKVFLEPDLDYGGYVVVCPSLPGCYSQGKTVSEALANIREAIELALEDTDRTLRSRSRSITLDISPSDCRSELANPKMSCCCHTDSAVLKNPPKQEMQQSAKQFSAA